MTGLRVDVTARRDTFALDVNLSLPPEGVTVIFGPSGSGKTTLLRAIAGLGSVDRARVDFGEATWHDTERRQYVPPEQRRLGYVFQQAALFPHLSVRGNLRFAFDRVPAGRRRVDVDQVARWLALESMLDRGVSTLSGGERRRVAIGRAIAASPELLLMDEPLAGLDAPARHGVVERLHDVTRELAAPLVYVTHSLDEVAWLADRVVWLTEGKARATAPPGELLGRLDFGLAQGAHAAALVEATVKRHDDDDQITELDSVWGPWFIRRIRDAVGAGVRLRISASDVSLARERETASSILNALPARVEAIAPAGPGEVMVGLACPADSKAKLMALITKRSSKVLDLKAGQTVLARVKGVRLD